jgi:hypothetical protein
VAETPEGLFHLDTRHLSRMAITSSRPEPRQIRFVRPLLPPWLEFVQTKNLNSARPRRISC